MTTDPFRVLGLHSGATPVEIRAARRELARTHHPDVGGEAAEMQAVNAAAAEALRRIASRDQPAAPEAARPRPQTDWVGATRDVPSFTVEALPVETFEALLLATKELGEVEDDDPPYELRVVLAEPLACWCQLDVVPDAGASTVSLTIAAVEGSPLPRLVDVRNAWIGVLNGLDWSTL